MKKYVVATRPSLLAYTQTKQVVQVLKEKNPGCEFEIVKFLTHGDKVVDKPLVEFGGTGLFVKELENAILNGEADFAVHSLKDVPGIQPDNLILASFPKREDPRDIVLTSTGIGFSQLKDNCIIGTSSPRRILQLKILKPGAVFSNIRGNIDTRIGKLQSGQYDAIVLAAAGLKRIGREIPANAFLSSELCIPAIGQGAIAIECKTGDKETINMLRSINDNETEIAITAERSFMKTIGGGCKFPLAAYATIENNMVSLNVMIGDHNTSKIAKFFDKSTTDQSEALGIKLAHKIQEAAKKLNIDIII